MINKLKSLTPDSYQVLIESSTEPPHTGEYNVCDSKGTYLCRLCGLALFRSDFKFTSACGWPSFDDEIKGSLLRLPDPDGRREEIRCKRCEGHLGHVFMGEGFTSKNLRHCVNSLSIDFVENESVLDTEEVIVAGGCFWGLEHHLRKEKGVLYTESGYIGGSLPHPTYQRISRKDTGYYEAVRLLYDTQQTTLEEVYKAFFEWHDPTQIGGQGPDLGPQYESAIFFYTSDQEQIALRLIQELQEKGCSVQTRLLEMSPFWKAEKEHQDYLLKNPGGYCTHKKKKRF